MTQRRWLACAAALLLAACAGGGSASYSEADNHREVEADEGTTFTVSLPIASGKAAAPAYSTNVLLLVGDLRDEAARRRTLKFQAKAVGSTEIRVAPDFSLNVRVVSSSDRPGMHVHTR